MEAPFIGCYLPGLNSNVHASLPYSPASPSSWSDGLPTEGVSGASVLSRVAMMALIRSKVLEYEEFNVIPRLVSQVTTLCAHALCSVIGSRRATAPVFIHIIITKLYPSAKYTVMFGSKWSSRGVLRLRNTATPEKPRLHLWATGAAWISAKSDLSWFLFRFSTSISPASFAVFEPRICAG